MAYLSCLSLSKHGFAAELSMFPLSLRQFKCHMTKMAAMPMYGKNPLIKIFSDFHETWYVASGTPVHHSLFK